MPSRYYCLQFCLFSYTTPERTEPIVAAPIMLGFSSFFSSSRTEEPDGKQAEREFLDNAKEFLDSRAIITLSQLKLSSGSTIIVDRSDIQRPCVTATVNNGRNGFTSVAILSYEGGATPGGGPVVFMNDMYLYDIEKETTFRWCRPGDSSMIGQNGEQKWGAGVSHNTVWHALSGAEQDVATNGRTLEIGCGMHPLCLPLAINGSLTELVLTDTNGNYTDKIGGRIARIGTGMLPKGVEVTVEPADAEWMPNYEDRSFNVVVEKALLLGSMLSMRPLLCSQIVAEVHRVLDDKHGIFVSVSSSTRKELENVVSGRFSVLKTVPVSEGRYIHIMAKVPTAETMAEEEEEEDGICEDVVVEEQTKTFSWGSDDEKVADGEEEEDGEIREKEKRYLSQMLIFSVITELLADSPASSVSVKDVNAYIEENYAIQRSYSERRLRDMLQKMVKNGKLKKGSVRGSTFRINDIGSRRKSSSISSSSSSSSSRKAIRGSMSSVSSSRKAAKGKKKKDVEPESPSSTNNTCFRKALSYIWWQ
eukprot:jgi/Bigna1/78231/fgenesh1_pg.53_\